MRIANIHIDKKKAENFGLKEINFTDRQLGSTIALIGKNGAGKSRILKLVEEWFNNITRTSFLNDVQFIPDRIISVEEKNKLKNEVSILKKSNKIINIDENHNTSIEPLYQKMKVYLMNYIHIIDPFILKNIENNENLKNKNTGDLKNNLLKSLINNNNQSLEKKEIDQIQKNIDILFSNDTISVIETIIDDLLLKEFNLYVESKNNLDSSDYIKNNIKNHKSFRNFEVLKKYVSIFLKMELSYKGNPGLNSKINSVLLLNGENLEISKLSPGQKTLFSYSILFYLIEYISNIELNESIIIIDEPENHLHPSAQIELIKALKELVKEKGQLWISTHSIHILCQLDYNEIYLVKEGKIYFPSSKNIPIILEELIGLEENLEMLYSLVSSISEWEFSSFVNQCFKDPESIHYTIPNDPQFELFKSFIISLNVNNVNLLDYGAGTGRLIRELFESSDFKNLSYSALEPDINKHKYLKEFGEDIKLYTYSKDLPNQSQDVILLCNVLHEIPVLNWEHEIKEIKRILKPNGYLLILEDKYLPKGEWIDKTGYLILSNKELKKMFKSEFVIEVTSKDNRYKGRIVMNIIRYDFIDSIDVISAIDELRKNVFKQIKSIKAKGKNEANGRIFANLTQLYVNANLAHDLLDSQI